MALLQDGNRKPEEWDKIKLLSVSYLQRLLKGIDKSKKKDIHSAILVVIFI